MSRNRPEKAVLHGQLVTQSVNKSVNICYTKICRSFVNVVNVIRVAKVGSLSADAKMATKFSSFVYFRVLMHFLSKKHCF